MEAQTDGPFYVCHTLCSYPAKVEVQVRVQTQDHGEQIFSGIGSAQRDDDMDVPYGGIVYLYNTTHVILFVPKNAKRFRSSDRGTLAYTGKDGYYVTQSNTAYVIELHIYSFIVLNLQHSSGSGLV
jgi:hypothetical protein